MICCYCQEEDTQTGMDNSHGICESCYDLVEVQVLAELEGMEVGAL